MYDIIIIGGGPAGLTAALYARRAGKTVLVIEKGTFGGQITFSPKVENISGFISISGNEFAEKLTEQVLEHGAEVECAEVLEIKDGNNIKTVVTDCGEFCACAVIIATGAKHRMLGLPREENLVGKGISFCAVCDGAFFANRNVAVIGGGNSAMQEALLLSELAKKVFVVQNLDHCTGEQTLLDQLNSKPNIEILYNSTVTELLGEDALSGIIVKDATQNSIKLDVDGMFIAIGLVPQNEFAKGIVALNDSGYIISDESCTLNSAGIFAAGDCRAKNIRQVATAVADGAVAALAACEYVENLK